MKPIKKIVLSRMLSNLISFSIIAVRSLLGPVYCSFEVGCTTYAVTQLKEQPLLPAIRSICKRLISCTFAH